MLYNGVEIVNFCEKHNISIEDCEMLTLDFKLIN